MKIGFRKSRSNRRSLIWTGVASAAAAVFITRNFFEFEKKIRHLITTDYGPDDPRFRRTMSQLLGPPLVEGNKVTPLQNGVQIFPAMLAGIRSAQRSITFENFILREGRIVDQFAEALGARAGRREGALFAGFLWRKLPAWPCDAPLEAIWRRG